MALAEAAAEAGHVVVDLPIRPEAYGLLAFGGLMTLLFITFAFRSIGTRH